MAMETLCVMFQLLLKKCKTLKICWEEIESNGVIRLLEVVGYKESLMLQLVKPPKIPRLVGAKQLVLQEDGKNNLGVEEGGCKIFMRAKGIPRDEEEEVHLVELRRVVGCKRESQTEKLVGLAMVAGSKWRWRLVSKSRFRWDL
ncbi:hypothetical protein L195_g047212 [Trifolium pratense]|uniref:Uncharacterized protein n=1 Tax=Trifolium pratense TaxID=57577 RepID=A0A2K3MJS0_TRIPR|nr:hypothetical protein L195_g047212 [Trifolium pratense]